MMLRTYVLIVVVVVIAVVLWRHDQRLESLENCGAEVCELAP
jgi:hypothetical protein